MLIITGIALAGLFGMILHFAVSRKSSPGVKKMALGALIFIIIFAGVCIYIIFSGPAALESGKVQSQDPYAPPASPAQNMLVFFMVLAALLAVLAYVALRERKIRKSMKIKDTETEARAEPGKKKNSW